MTTDRRTAPTVKSLGVLEQMPFYKLTADEKKRLVAHKMKVADNAGSGREASVARMVADTLRDCQ